LSILLSRLICLRAAVPPPDRPADPLAEALVPWADFLNHGPSCRSHLALSQAGAGACFSLPFFGVSAVPGGGSVVLEADRSYARGQQVFVSYGQKPSGELLLSYGFVPTPGTNPHESADVHVAVRDLAFLVSPQQEHCQHMRAHALMQLTVTGYWQSIGKPAWAFKSTL
jgi:hypothetical protein